MNQQSFLELWSKSATTTVGLFWMAFWAFGLGYLISSMIQVLVTRKRMRKTMGKAGPRSVFLGTFFGFISSSCSFAALSGARALFAKGAGLIPSLAFLLASTNLVIELGIVIAVFLSWQFVVGEYVGGLLLILCAWAIVKLTLPKGLEKSARDHAKEKEGHDHDHGNDADKQWQEKIGSRQGWLKIAQQYTMEWDMVWKDVTIGFTVAGVIAAFVPQSFFQSLFIGSGNPDASFFELLAQAAIGPVAAFFTFIGSMGNIPLAAVLFSNGVSFAGVIAFIFSDLVVFPVLRIQASYYGWKMASYILAVFLAGLIATALALHYGASVAGLLPDPETARSVVDREFFKLDYTAFLNLLFIALSGGFWLWKKKAAHEHDMSSSSIGERILFTLALVAFAWLAGGLLIAATVA